MLIKHQIDYHRSNNTPKRRKILGFLQDIEKKSVISPETNHDYEILTNVALRKDEYNDSSSDGVFEQKKSYSESNNIRRENNPKLVKTEAKLKTKTPSDLCVVESEIIKVELKDNVASNRTEQPGQQNIKRKNNSLPSVPKRRKHLTCDVCEQQFWNKASILNHLHRKHVAVAKDKEQLKPSECILCETCGREYSNRKRLLIHLKTHQARRLYKCTMCDREFLDKGALREHAYAHTGERPFKCLYGCDQYFAHASNRRQHHRSFHQPEKRFTCTICAKILTRKYGYL